MWKNKHVINVAVIAIWIGFVSVELGITASGAGTVYDTAPAASEFEGRLEFYKHIPVGITAGTSEHPELVRIETVCFDTKYANASGATVRVGWQPVKDATWLLTIELLDAEGRVLRHSRDEPTVFTGKAGAPGQTDTRHADLDLDPMHDQGRRHARRFRVHLEPLKERLADADSTHTLEVAVLDQENREPLGEAAVVVSSSYLKEKFRRNKALYVTDSQGHCRITLVRDGLVRIGISAQKQGYCTIAKYWSNSGSWPLGRTPIVNLPQRHVLEMVRALALGGIVRDTEGNTVTGAEVHIDVHLEEPSGIIYVNRAVRTDADGRWRIDGIPGDAERFTLRVRHPDYGGDNGRNRHISGDTLVNALALKHVETLEKGLTITGHVFDDKGQPAAGATVMLAQQSYNAMHVLTDTSGTFRLVCSSDPSDYPEAPAIIVEAPGYALVQQPFALQRDPKTLEFRLQHGRSVTCRVVDTKGQPVVGAWTVVEPLPGNRDYSVWLEDTDDQGEFQVLNVPQNDVKLTVGKEGFLAIRDHVVPASEDEVVVTMKRAMDVHGAVTDAETGKPIPNFEIAAVYTTDRRTNTSSLVAFTDGTYDISFNEARSETCQLQVSAVGYEPATSEEIKIDEGQRTIDFKLARSQSFDKTTAGRPREEVKPTGPRRITGVVRDEKGRPVSDAVVSTHPRLAKEAITNAEGAFTLRTMRILGSTSGTMRSREETTYLLVRNRERNLAAAIELDDDAETVEIKLIPGVILSGKVVDVEGKGIPNAEMSLIFWSSGSGYSSREVTDINAEGYYQIRAVPLGHKYSVTATAEGYGQQYVSVNTAEAADNRIELEPLALAVADLSLSGVVVDVEDKPVAGVRIYAYGRGQPNRNTITDEMGRFLIENVCKGRIQIQANKSVPERLHARIEAEVGATDLKIVVAEMDAIGRRVTKQPPSLVGKSLPELKDLKIGLSPAELRGKIILICFFDMQQRPSRYCITQLAKQAVQLEQKGVTLVAVQASEIDENKLNEWIKENNIPFSVGMIQGDEKKTRFTWGVKSLPWLILTDAEHVAIAEGFALTELEEKITSD